MGIVLVDGKEIEIADNERLNGIQVARRAGVEIPHYCWHPGLPVVASCRMCLVKTGTRNAETGEVSVMPKLVPACQTPARDGTVFITDDDSIRNARGMVEEKLLIDHPIDCPICDKAGECNLQDYHFQHGRDSRRADLKPFTSRRREMGSTVSLFVDRCVMCTRCVRFTREISGDSELMIVNRGSHEEIDVFPGYPLENKLSGNVVDLCPVGALGDKSFLYQQRVWFMKKHDQVCAGCSTGCSISVDENQDTVFRLKPRENPHVNQWWICDEGRYGWKYIHSPDRLTQPTQRSATATPEAIEWTAIQSRLKAELTKTGSLGVLVSPMLTVEEAYLLCQLAREIDPQATLALGYIPTEGSDETFRNGFTIHAEKAPNRRGVEAVLRHFTVDVTSYEEFLNKLDQKAFKSVWVTAGYSSPWIDEATAARFDGVEQLVVQDIFSSPLTQKARYVLPSGTFAERAGSFVNYQDRLQAFDWAIRPPVGVWVEGPLYWQLLGRAGMYDPGAALHEVGQNIAAYSAVLGEIPSVGIDLKVNLLASAEASSEGQA